MRTWIVAALTLLASVGPFANASVGPLAMPLNVPQGAVLQRYTSSQTGACLVLDAGRTLGDQDAAGLQKLIADLDVHAGPGVMPETAAAGIMPYVYNLVPELKGSRLVYRGLLSSSRGDAVRVQARGPASLAEVVSRDLGFTGNVSFVFSTSCE
jgi:hypothetical protein